MSEWKAKRFWDRASVVPAGAGYAVLLDDRPLRTPAKRPLQVPTLALAEAIAAEWDAQTEIIDPGSMPLTRTANSAIDKVQPQQAEVVRHLAGYGDTDLVCYRAEAPAELVARQAKAWDPLLDWARSELGVSLRAVTGVMHAPQDPADLRRLQSEIEKMTPSYLAGFHDLVALSGSLVIALATARGALAPTAAWRASRVDEIWQQEQWGTDELAATSDESKKNAFLDAARFLDFLA